MCKHWHLFIQACDRVTLAAATDLHALYLQNDSVKRRLRIPGKKITPTSAKGQRRSAGWLL
jgi:hypothetical protein